jgi:hypothetical protein
MEEVAVNKYIAVVEAVEAFEHLVLLFLDMMQLIFVAVVLALQHIEPVVIVAAVVELEALVELSAVPLT